MRHHGRINEESEIRVDCKNLQQRRHSSRALERERPGGAGGSVGRPRQWVPNLQNEKVYTRRIPTHLPCDTSRHHMRTARPDSMRQSGHHCHLVPPFDASGERTHDTRGHDLKDHERETARCRCRLKVVRRTP